MGHYLKLISVCWGVAQMPSIARTKGICPPDISKTRCKIAFNYSQDNYDRYEGKYFKLTSFWQGITQLPSIATTNSPKHICQYLCKKQRYWFEIWCLSAQGVSPKHTKQRFILYVFIWKIWRNITIFIIHQYLSKSPN